MRKGNGGRQPSAGPAVTIDVPDKNLKFSRADIEERERWKDNQRAYEACLTAADEKENARLIISEVILDTLGELKLSYPKPDKGHRKELQSIRKSLGK